MNPTLKYTFRAHSCGYTDAHLPYSNVTLHTQIYIQGDSFPLPFTLTMPTSRSQRLCPLSECKVVYVCLCVSGKEYVQVFLCFECGHVAAYKETVCVCVCLLECCVPVWLCVTESVCVGGGCYLNKKERK